MLFAYVGRCFAVWSAVVPLLQLFVRVELIPFRVRLSRLSYTLSAARPDSPRHGLTGGPTAAPPGAPLGARPISLVPFLRAAVAAL